MALRSEPSLHPLIVSMHFQFGEIPFRLISLPHLVVMPQSRYQSQWSAPTRCSANSRACISSCALSKEALIIAVTSSSVKP